MKSGQYGSCRSSDGLTVSIDYAMSQPDGKTETTEINHSERLQCSRVNPVDRLVNDKDENKPDPNIKCKGVGFERSTNGDFDVRYEFGDIMGDAIAMTDNDVIATKTHASDSLTLKCDSQSHLESIMLSNKRKCTM